MRISKLFCGEDPLLVFLVLRTWQEAGSRAVACEILKKLGWMLGWGWWWSHSQSWQEACLWLSAVSHSLLETPVSLRRKIWRLLSEWSWNFTTQWQSPWVNYFGGEILRDFGKVLLPPTLALESYLTVLSITAAKYFFPSVSQFLRVLLENSFTKTFQDFSSTY